MSAIPVLTRTYFGRINQPYGANNTTQALLEAFWVWSLYANLTNQATGGTTAGSRNANSIWIVRGASNGTSFSACTSAGVANPTANALWGNGTFNISNFVRGTQAASHSWILLENVNLGYELLINYSQTATYVCMSYNKTPWFATGTGSSVGTLAQFPLPATVNQNASNTLASGADWTATDGGQVNCMGDTGTFGGTNYFHFVCADSGEFYVTSTRAGLGVFTSFAGFWKSVNNNVGDTQNYFCLCSDTTISGRGTMQSSRFLVTDAARSKAPAGTKVTTGGITCPNGIAGIGADALTGFYNVGPLDLWASVPQVLRRGSLPDLYVVGTATVGSSIPSTAAQERIVLGDLIVPMPTVVPLL